MHNRKAGSHDQAPYPGAKRESTTGRANRSLACLMAASSHATSGCAQIHSAWLVKRLTRRTASRRTACASSVRTYFVRRSTSASCVSSNARRHASKADQATLKARSASRARSAALSISDARARSLSMRFTISQATFRSAQGTRPRISLPRRRDQGTETSNLTPRPAPNASATAPPNAACAAPLLVKKSRQHASRTANVTERSSRART